MVDTLCALVPEVDPDERAPAESTTRVCTGSFMNGPNAMRRVPSDTGTSTGSFRRPSSAPLAVSVQWSKYFSSNNTASIPSYRHRLLSVLRTAGPRSRFRSRGRSIPHRGHQRLDRTGGRAERDIASKRGDRRGRQLACRGVLPKPPNPAPNASAKEAVTQTAVEFDVAPPVEISPGAGLLGRSVGWLGRRGRSASGRRGEGSP